MPRPSLSTWLIAATILMVAAFALSFRWLGSSPAEDASADALGGAIVLQDVELHGREAGRPSWTVRASSLTLARDRKAGEIVGLHDGVFYDQGRLAATFAADRLSYQDTVLGVNGGLELTGHIRVTAHAPPFAAAPVTVETDRIRWRMGDHHLICPEPVRAVVGTLGAITTKTLMLDTQTHSVEAGPVLVVADASGSPIPSLTTASSGPAKPAVKSPEKVTFSAPEGGRWDDAAQTLTLTGPVTFKQGAATMTTTGAIYNRRTKSAHSESPVTITDETSTVTGDHGTIDFGAHTATLADNVTMTVRPSPGPKGQSDPDADVKQPTTLTCQEIVYDYRAKRAHTAGKVVIKQIDRTVTADSGQYDVTSHIADLVGNVVATSSDGKVFHAPSAKISTETGKESVEVNGPITGILPGTDEDAPASSASPTAPKSPPKPTKP